MTIRAVMTATLVVALGASTANADYLSVSATYLKPSKSSFSSKLPNPDQVYDFTFKKPDLRFKPESVGGNLGFESSVGFVVTYGFEFSDGMALELELATRSGKGNNITIGTEVSYDHNDGDSGNDVKVLANGSHSVATKISSNSVMANFVLPFQTGGRMTPYFGAGIGFAQASFDGLTLNFNALSGSGDSADGTPKGHSIVKKSSNSSLAYQFMAGVRFPVSDSMQLKFGYRYFGINDLEFDNFSAKFSSHELDFGVLMSF